MPKKKKKPLAGTNSPAALRTRSVSVRCHCVPAGRGRRTDERRRAPQTKQRLTQFTKLREPARQGCLEPFLRREAPPCCVDQQEQPSDINVLSCHPPPPAGQPAPMSFSPIHHPQPARVSWNFPCAALQSSPWFLLPWVPSLAGLLPQISREPTKLLLQRPPLVGRTRASKATRISSSSSSTSRCCHLCTARSFITPLQSRYWTVPGRTGLRREHHLRPIQEQCADVVDMHVRRRRKATTS